MNQSTQPDPDEENDIWQSASIRIKVVWKNARACSKKNVVKWLELAHSVECIRFVYNNAATMARCRNKMKGKKNIMVKQSRTVYQDVTVETGSAWKNARVLVTFSLKS
jgi:hypothetical protein